MNTQIVATFLVGLSLGLPSYAAAGVVTTTTGEADVEKTQWVKRITDAQHALDAANERYREAIRSYGNLRHRRRKRGERKREILEEQEAAREEVQVATRALEETLEAARRAGVPPGWVREALGEVQRGPAPAAPDH